MYPDFLLQPELGYVADPVKKGTMEALHATTDSEFEKTVKIMDVYWKGLLRNYFSDVDEERLNIISGYLKAIGRFKLFAVIAGLPDSHEKETELNNSGEFKSWNVKGDERKHICLAIISPNNFIKVQLSKSCHAGLEYRTDSVTPSGIFLSRLLKEEKMNTGTIVKQRGSDCLDIRFGLYDYHGGLQCGETLDVKISGKWVPTRIEMGEDWYLVGINVDDIIGLIVRI